MLKYLSVIKMKDNYLVKAYCMHETVRIYAAITTGIVKHNQKIFNLYPTSCAALGRTLTMGAIMSCTYKNDDTLNIYVKGDGPIGKITIEATNGNVRGYCENPGVLLIGKDGKQDLSFGVGNGEITVVKDLHLRQPFSGSSEIISGEIAKDFTYYFTKSEQIPSAVGLSEVFDDDEAATIKAAGGFLVQVMPGCKEEDLLKLEDRLSKMKPLSEMLKEGYTALEIINEITDGDYIELEERELTSNCKCSKERFSRGLLTLKKSDLLEILEQDHKALITCNFCNKQYTFTEDDLKELIDAKN